MSSVRLLLLTVVGLIAGVVNTVAGGGSLLVLVQPRLARSLSRARVARGEPDPAEVEGGALARPGSGGLAPLPWRQWPLLLAVLVISIYGGYFGAAIGVLLIGVLGLFLEDSLQRTNALKNSLTMVVNGTAAVSFIFLGPVVWSVALVLGVSTVLGGMLGALVARRLSDRALRLAVVLIGLGAAVYSAVR